MFFSIYSLLRYLFFLSSKVCFNYIFFVNETIKIFTKDVNLKKKKNCLWLLRYPAPAFCPSDWFWPSPWRIGWAQLMQFMKLWRSFVTQQERAASPLRSLSNHPWSWRRWRRKQESGAKFVASEETHPRSWPRVPGWRKPSQTVCRASP